MPEMTLKLTGVAPLSVRVDCPMPGPTGTSCTSWGLGDCSCCLVCCGDADGSWTTVAPDGSGLPWSMGEPIETAAGLPPWSMAWRGLSAHGVPRSGRNRKRIRSSTVAYADKRQGYQATGVSTKCFGKVRVPWVNCKLVQLEISAKRSRKHWTMDIRMVEFYWPSVRFPSFENVRFQSCEKVR